MSENNYAVLQNGVFVATASDMGDGFYHMIIEGVDCVTDNLKLWAVERGYTLTGIDDIEITAHPMLPVWICYGPNVIPSPLIKIMANIESGDRDPEDYI